MVLTANETLLAGVFCSLLFAAGVSLGVDEFRKEAARVRRARTRTSNGALGRARSEFLWDSFVGTCVVAVALVCFYVRPTSFDRADASDDAILKVDETNYAERADGKTFVAAREHPPNEEKTLSVERARGVKVAWIPFESPVYVDVDDLSSEETARYNIR